MLPIYKLPKWNTINSGYSTPTTPLYLCTNCFYDYGHIENITDLLCWSTVCPMENYLFYFISFVYYCFDIFVCVYVGSKINKWFSLQSECEFTTNSVILHVILFQCRLHLLHIWGVCRLCWAIVSPWKIRTRSVIVLYNLLDMYSWQDKEGEGVRGCKLDGNAKTTFSLQILRRNQWNIVFPRRNSPIPHVPPFFSRTEITSTFKR